MSQSSHSTEIVVETSNELKQGNLSSPSPRESSVPASPKHKMASSSPSIQESIQYFFTQSYFNILLAMLPIAIASELVHWPDTVVFILNFIALIPLAKMLGMATEQISLYTNETIGGLLNATFGNAVELILSILALTRNLIIVVQASLLGSIYSNLLFVLGFAFLLGGFRYSEQTFNIKGAQTSASLLALSVLSLVIPAVFHSVHQFEEQPLLKLSRGTAVILLLLYLLFIVFQLKTHKHVFQSEIDESEPVEKPEAGFIFSIFILVASTAVIAVLGEFLVGSIEGLTKSWGISETFVGFVLLPVVGNAAEHLTAVTCAMKNKMDLAIGIALGSSIQIALFVTPIVVLVGWIIQSSMTLDFNIFETAILFVSVFVVNSLISDGASNWLEESTAPLLASHATNRHNYTELPGALPLEVSAPSNELDVSSSLLYIIQHSYLNILLIFVPFGIFASSMQWSGSVVFFINFLALIPLAKILGVTTEEIALRTNDTIGGLLNATFGNAVELILSIVSLRENLVRVVQASLLGSILSNLLFVLGLSFVCGGIKHENQTFNQTAAQTSASLLALTVMSWVIPAVFSSVIQDPETQLRLVLELSRATAVVLLLLYLLFLFFQLRTHKHFFESNQNEQEPETPCMTYSSAIGTLFVTTCIIAICGENLVTSIESLSETWGLTQTFVGIILLPIVGNAAEHLTAVTCAMKNKMDLSIGIGLGSSMQIALFVTPFCVIMGWFMGKDMSLHFTEFETVILFVSVFVVNSLISDGSSHWLEGAMLLGGYILVSVAFYLLPA